MEQISDGATFRWHVFSFLLHVLSNLPQPTTNDVSPAVLLPTRRRHKMHGGFRQILGGGLAVDLRRNEDEDWDLGLGLKMR